MKTPLTVKSCRLLPVKWRLSSHFYSHYQFMPQLSHFDARSYARIEERPSNLILTFFFKWYLHLHMYFFSLSLIFSFFSERNLVDPLKYSDAEFAVGLKILKAIAKRPALSMRQFEHSFLNQKIAWPLRIILKG